MLMDTPWASHGHANIPNKAIKHPERCLTSFYILERKTGFEPATLTLAKIR